MPSACFQCVDWLAVENMPKACPYGLLVIMLRFGVGITALCCYLYAFGICCVGIISDPLRGSAWGVGHCHQAALVRSCGALFACMVFRMIRHLRCLCLVFQVFQVFQVFRVFQVF